MKKLMLLVVVMLVGCAKAPSITAPQEGKGIYTAVEASGPSTIVLQITADRYNSGPMTIAAGQFNLPYIGGAVTVCAEGVTFLSLVNQNYQQIDTKTRVVAGTLCTEGE